MQVPVGLMKLLGKYTMVASRNEHVVESVKSLAASNVLFLQVLLPVAHPRPEGYIFDERIVWR